MTWEITFYNEKVKRQIRLFPIGIQTNLTYILELIEELGPHLGKPHTAPLGKGLFEIRAKGKKVFQELSFVRFTKKKLSYYIQSLKKTQKHLKKIWTLQ